MFRVERCRGSVWFAKYRVADGRQVQTKIGPAWSERGRPAAGYFTTRQAEAWPQDLLRDARRGTLRGMARSGVTFAEAAEEWMRFIKEDRERSLAGLSNRSKNKLLIQLHGIFRRAQIVWDVPVNPLARVEKHPMRASGDIQVFSPEEVWALVRAAASEQDGALFLSAAFTGLRMGEPLALRWRDVDFSGATMRVRASYADRERTTPKSGKVRTVPAHGRWGLLVDRHRFPDRLSSAGPSTAHRRDSLGGVALQTWMLDHALPGRLGTTARQLSYTDAQGGRPNGFPGGRLDRNLTLYRRGV